LATKAAMSSEADGFASGNEPDLPDAAFWLADSSVADFGLVGSPDISARKLQQSSMWAGISEWSMRAQGAGSCHGPDGAGDRADQRYAGFQF
jgi:hypothetical protein